MWRRFLGKGKMCLTGSGVDTAGKSPARTTAQNHSRFSWKDSECMNTMVLTLGSGQASYLFSSLERNLEKFMVRNVPAGLPFPIIIQCDPAR